MRARHGLAASSIGSSGHLYYWVSSGDIEGFLNSVSGVAIIAVEVIAMALVKKEIIQFIGVNKLEPAEQDAVMTLSEEYYGKIKRQIKNRMSLVVHVKTYKKQGSKVKYALHTRLIAPTRIFESCKSHDWDLSRALHKSFKDLISELKHSFHTDEQSGHSRKESRPKKKSARADSDIRGF